jgi:uncharacterized protein DUF402
MSRWNPGDNILLREVWQGRVWTARPVIVVEDSDQVIALHIAEGSIWKRPFGTNGSPKRIPVGDWRLGDEVWTTNVIRISAPGERFSVLPIRNAEVWRRAWYLNIETPLQRTSIGFDYMDQTLDIIVSHDLSEWRWKDEEELAEAVARGVYTPAQAHEIRDAGEEALARFLKRGPPFDRDWDVWKPKPDWIPPKLSSSWDIVAETKRRP